MQVDTLDSVASAGYVREYVFIKVPEGYGWDAECRSKSRFVSAEADWAVFSVAATTAERGHTCQKKKLHRESAGVIS
jgi:hypothetical protein